MKIRILAIAMITIIITSTNAQFFTKITEGPLVNSPGDSRSVNWVDVNNDGWIDCFISNGPAGGQNNSLFINNKSGNFIQVTNDPIVKDNKPSDGASFADIDNDGDLDALVTNWYNVNKLLYLNNGDGTFVKIDSGKIVNDGGYSETAAWGDYDQDGLVDIYICNSDGDFRNFMYHNDGNNNFSKINAGSQVSDAYSSRCINWTDIDADGDLDLFVTNENNQNENIYRNDGSNSFVKLTNNALVTNLSSTMSSSWGDYDSDGDLDVFLANDRSVNALFRNDGNFNFTKFAGDTAVKTPSRSFSSAWSDIDNDGDLDLFVTNSFGTAKKQLNFFYINDGLGHFTRNNTDIIAQDSSWSYGCAFGDYDNDGFEDLVVATCRFGNIDYPDFLYRNNGNTNHWITIQLIGTISNKAAIGTKIKAKATIHGNPVWQIREISSQTSYCGQNDIRAHFGLGDATTVDSIIIEWPLGLIEYYTNVDANQFVRYIEKQISSSRDETENSLSNLIIYPNPTSKSALLTILNSRFNKNDIIILTDSTGRTIDFIQSSDSIQILIDLNNYKLQPGSYFIKFKRGHQEVTRSIIIN
jgi:hypothetical protein